jgi:hypothetical protein
MEDGGDEMWLSDTVADEIEEDEEEKWLKKRRSRLASVPGYLFLVFAKQTNINTSKFWISYLSNINFVEFQFLHPFFCAESLLQCCILISFCTYKLYISSSRSNLES